MKLLYSFFFLFTVSVSFAQDISVEFSKEEVKLDEIFEVTFEVKDEVSEIQHPDFKNFEEIEGPSTNTFSTDLFGKKTSSFSVTYTLRPLKNGNLKVESPEIFVDGKRVKIKQRKIVVLDQKMTQEELDNQLYEQLKDDFSIPDGTYKIIFMDNVGYLAIKEGYKWEIIRRLTSEEILILEEILSN